MTVMLAGDTYHEATEAYALAHAQLHAFSQRTRLAMTLDAPLLTPPAPPRPTARDRETDLDPLATWMQ